MHLVSEKNLNKFAYPVFPIKGREIKHPYTAGEGKFICTAGYMKPENWMIMDVLGTYICHRIFNNDGNTVHYGMRLPNVRLQMVLDSEGLKLREGFSSHINHSCLSGKFQKAILLPS